MERHGEGARTTCRAADRRDHEHNQQFLVCNFIDCLRVGPPGRDGLGMTTTPLHEPAGRSGRPPLSNPGLYPLQFCGHGGHRWRREPGRRRRRPCRHRRRSADAQSAARALLATRGADLPLKPHHRHIARAGDFRRRLTWARGGNRSGRHARAPSMASRHRFPNQRPNDSTLDLRSSVERAE